MGTNRLALITVDLDYFNLEASFVIVKAEDLGLIKLNKSGVKEAILCRIQDVMRLSTSASELL